MNQEQGGGSSKREGGSDVDTVSMYEIKEK